MRPNITTCNFGPLALEDVRERSAAAAATAAAFFIATLSQELDVQAVRLLKHFLEAKRTITPAAAPAGCWLLLLLASLLPLVSAARVAPVAAATGRQSD